jgi:hypothetical protein
MQEVPQEHSSFYSHCSSFHQHYTTVRHQQYKHYYYYYYLDYRCMYTCTLARQFHKLLLFNDCIVCASSFHNVLCGFYMHLNSFVAYAAVAVTALRLHATAHIAQINYTLHADMFSSHCVCCC